MSMIPPFDGDVTRSGEATRAPNLEAPTVSPTTDAFLLSSRVPPHPRRLRHRIDREGSSLITTSPSLERASTERSRDTEVRAIREPFTSPRNEERLLGEKPSLTSSSLQTKKKKGFSKQALFVIRVGITLVLLVLTLRGIFWSEVATTSVHVHVIDLLVGLDLGTLSVVFSSSLWHRLVRAENIRADMAHLTSLYLIGVGLP